MPRIESSAGTVNLAAHLAVWLVLTLFPVSLSATGNVNAAQIMLHGTMVALIVGLVFVRGFARPAGMPLGLFLPALVLVTGTVAYFAVLSSLNVYSGSTGDVLDVFRPVVYLAYFSVPFLVPLRRVELERLLLALLALAAFQILFSALVYFPASWNLVNLYKGRTSGDAVVFHFFRWSGTHGYPSDFAFYLSFFFYFLFVARHRFLPAAVHYALLGLTGIALVMTMSRGGLGTVAAMSVIGAVLFGRIRLLALGAGAAAVLVIGLLTMQNDVDEDRVNTAYVLDLVERGTEAESARHRMSELDLAIGYAGERFPLGLGAARDDIYSRIRVVESLYGHYLIKWGALGLLLYLVSIVYLSRAAWFVWRTSDELVLRYFGGAFFLLAVSVPLVFGLSSAVTDRFKGLPFFYLLAGYAARLYESRRPHRLPAWLANPGLPSRFT